MKISLTFDIEYYIYCIICTITVNVACYDKLALWQYNNATNLQPTGNTIVSSANIYRKGEFNLKFDISDITDSPVPP